VIALVISIVFAVLILGEIGREIGLWVPKWNRQEVSKDLPGWSVVISYGELLFFIGTRAYYFFRPANGYKER